jgi:hypothetical protein
LCNPYIRIWIAVGVHVDEDANKWLCEFEWILYYSVHIRQNNSKSVNYTFFIPSNSSRAN